MNEEAADALLKDLEEPPPYAVIVLVADELGPLPETIRSRCQLIPFRRLSERAIRARDRAGRGPGLSAEETTAYARIASGRLDRVERLLDAKAADRRAALLDVARSVYLDPDFQPAAAAKVAARRRALARWRCPQEGRGGARVARPAAARGGAARPPRGAGRRARGDPARSRRARRLVPRPRRGRRRRPRASRSTSTGSPSCARTAHGERMIGAEAAAERVRETWRLFEELQLQAGLALEALFIQLRRELASAVAVG